FRFSLPLVIIRSVNDRFKILICMVQGGFLLLELLKQEVGSANHGLVNHDLVTFTWGNVSGFDPEKELLAIKPSGVPYEDLSPKDIVVVDLKGNVVEGDLKPSSDTPTHIELYKAFSGVHGIVHTHSDWGTAWAQAGKSIPCSGT